MSRKGNGPAPSPKGTGPKEAAARLPLTANSSRLDRQDRAEHAGRAAWAAAVARRRLGLAARTVAGQLVDCATSDGWVRAAAADLAASCCLAVTALANTLADLASRGLLARDGGALVLTLPAGRWSP
jgi:hypothetical protein